MRDGAAALASRSGGSARALRAHARRSLPAGGAGAPAGGAAAAGPSGDPRTGGSAARRRGRLRAAAGRGPRPRLRGLRGGALRRGLPPRAGYARAAGDPGRHRGRLAQGGELRRDRDDRRVRAPLRSCGDARALRRAAGPRGSAGTHHAGSQLAHRQAGRWALVEPAGRPPLPRTAAHAARVAQRAGTDRGCRAPLCARVLARILDGGARRTAALGARCSAPPHRDIAHPATAGPGAGR